MSAWEDRFFLLALASGSIAFVLFVVDVGETPLVFENFDAEALFSLPFVLWQSWRLMRQLGRRRPEPISRPKSLPARRTTGWHF